MGRNLVSKVLAAYDPKTWPVFNNSVKEALDHFGYRAPRGVGEAGRYLAYTDLMREFVYDCEKAGVTDIDMLALDVFFRRKPYREER